MNEQSENRRKDRHRSPFMVRLPEIFRTKLLLCAARSGQAMTALVKLALKQYFKRAGLWTKHDDQLLAEQERNGKAP